MTKEEINILCDLYDMKALFMKNMYEADGLMVIYKKDNENESAAHQSGRKNAYVNAITTISEVINKIKNGGYNG